MAREVDVAPLTRRRFITTSAIGAGALTAVPGVSKLLAQTQSGCSIASNFNGTPIAGGDYVWFNSVLKVHGLNPQQQVTVTFVPMPITFSANGTPVMIPVPPAAVTFIPNLPLATTDFVAGAWATNVPSSGLAGNVFLDGVAFLVPSGGLPGGIQSVVWPGMFFSCTKGLTVQWQWAAAVYHNAGFLSGDYEGLGVKPTDDNQASLYKNSDHAGTPENFRPYVIGGARGGGGSNFTGSYSGTASCVPMVGSTGGCFGS
jgi:hypothetical protein